MLQIPWYIKMPLALAMNVLLNSLKGKIGDDILQKVKEVLTFLGLLSGGAPTLTHDEMAERFSQVHPHCSGIGCASDTKGLG